MMQSKIQILLMFIQLGLQGSIAQVTPIIQSSPIIQTGNWSCSTNCSLYTSKALYITINFTNAFFQIPSTGVVITQLNDTSLGNNVVLTTNAGSTLTTLVSFQIYIGSSNCQNFSLGWIATSSLDVFITQPTVTSHSTSFSYLTWLPQNVGTLESFILMRGGYTSMGGTATSILDTVHSQVTVTLNPSWDTTQSSTYYKSFFIVVNSQSTTSNNTQLRVLSGQFQWFNQKTVQIPTFLVQTGQKQNMLIGLQSYYNAQSNWTLAISQLSSNQSSITYSLNFNPLSIVTFQYLQIEVFVCVNSVYLSDNCTCNTGYFASLNICQCNYQFYKLECDYSCLNCITQLNKCTSCPPLSLRNLNGSSCSCQMGYYDNNQVNCSTCNSTCLSCFGGSSSQCTACDLTQNLALINGSCICGPGYFQNTTKQCQSCDLTCYQCTGKMINQCSVCRYSSFLNSQNSCQSCNYSCLACIEMSSCQACNITNKRNIRLGQCPCNDGYYDDGLSQSCQSCDYSCMTCSTSQNFSCITCNATQFRNITTNITTNSCPCNPRYFNQLNNGLCLACHHSCYTCDDATTTCISCQQNDNRVMSGMNTRSCPCIDGFYDDGFSQACYVCHYSCLTCKANSFLCQTCQILYYRNMILTQCACENGYYDDGSSKVCSKCHYQCLTCSVTSNFCLTCQGQNQRFFEENQCPCKQNYYDDGVRAICQQCHPTCLNCDGNSSSNCISCDINSYRILNQNMCLCQKDHIDTKGVCQAIVGPDTQTAKPQCQTLNCMKCEKNICLQCDNGFFIDNQACQPCNIRCQQCYGAQTNQCITCQFMAVDNQCKLCSEILGLYDVGGKCLSICGDGIVYKPDEECDDGNLDDDDSCSSQCLFVPIVGTSQLTFTNGSSIFNNTRMAIVSFQYQYTADDFQQWQFLIPNYDPNSYNLTYIFLQNQILINISFNQSLQGNYLTIKATEFSPLINQEMRTLIPDYVYVSQDVQQVTQNVISSSTVLYDLILVIMAIAFITGGFNMIFELLDLLQLLSYLKYLNVNYPYNVYSFFDYLSGFNFQQITNKIPLISNYNLDSYVNDFEQAAIQPSDKIQQDGYVTLFYFNFVGIFWGWVCALLTYLISRLILVFFSRWNNLDQLQEFQGLRRTIYMFRFTVCRFIVSIFSQFKENFFFNGLLRTFMASEYALNFSLMLELNQTHFDSEGSLLVSSSYLALLILSLQIIIIRYVINQVMSHQKSQFQQNKIQSSIGAAVEGFDLDIIGAKYFGVLDLMKIFIFMFSLVVLYDNPLCQVAGVMLTSLIPGLLYLLVQPYEDKEDYYKTISREILLFLAQILILLFVVDDEINFLDDDQKVIIGWVIIACCLTIITIQIIIDVKIHMRFMVKQLRSLVRFIKNRIEKFKNPKRVKLINQELNVQQI